ncbi:MAG TPA: hypothetical protein VMT95_12755 [Candidatus Binatia bacterium]|nr:hypothetical protein [Candidatus Binatia bacterium]
MKERTTVVLSVEPTSDGHITVRATPMSDPARLSVDHSTLVLTYWREDQGILRGSVEHADTGTVAHFQSSVDALGKLASAINLRAEHSSVR